MKVVLDTNVLVSGLLNPYGHPGTLVRFVSSGEITLCYDARILLEYEEVLLRPQFRIDTLVVEAILDQIRYAGHPVSAKPLKKHLPHRDDEVFLEVALAGQAVSLVTGNIRHYPLSCVEGMKVLSPKDFLGHLYERH